MEQNKRILCYGDSNTWGYRPGVGTRLEENRRWTGLLGREPGLTVVEAGLSGRTTVWDDPFSRFLNGGKELVPQLLMAAPLDLVILELGTNDLNCGHSAYEAARGVRALIEEIGRWHECFRDGRCQVLLLAPPQISASAVSLSPMLIGGRGYRESLQFSAYYQAMAEKTGAAFLDIAMYAQPSAEDGIHLDAVGHRNLARAVAEKVREIFAGVPENSARRPQ